MKFKNKRHLILTLKKKSGIELSVDEAKELMGLEPKEEEKKPEDKDKPAAAAAKSDEKVCDDKKPEDKKTVEEKADAPAPKTMSLEEVGAALAQLQENMNMIMEAVATMMEGQVAPAEEVKADDKPAEDKEELAKEEKEVEVSIEDKEDEEEMSDDEMEKELEKTIAELESLG